MFDEAKTNLVSMTLSPNPKEIRERTERCENDDRLKCWPERKKYSSIKGTLLLDASNPTNGKSD